MNEELTALKGAVEPLLELIPGGEGQSLAEPLQSAGARMTGYVKEMARTVVRGVLAAVKINMPDADPRKVIRVPRESSAEALAAAQAEVSEAANKYADHLELF